MDFKFLHAHAKALNLKTNSFPRVVPSQIILHPARRARSSPYVTKYLGAEATFIGRGIQGMAYMVKSGPALEHLRERLTSRVGPDIPLPREQPVLLKVMAVNAIDDLETNTNLEKFKEAWKDAPDHEKIYAWHYTAACGQHEAEILEYLRTKYPDDDVFPRLYFAGVDLEHGVYVLGMQFFGDYATFYNWNKEPRTKNEEDYKKKSLFRLTALMEKALLYLWNAGFVHTDLHEGNMLVGNRATSFVIIDFGMAFRVDPGTRMKGSPDRGPRH